MISASTFPMFSAPRLILVLAFAVFGAPVAAVGQSAPAPGGNGPCANATEPATAEALDALTADAQRLLDASASRPALACFERALAAARQQNLPDRIAATGSGVGLALQDLGRYAEARTQFEQALALFREQGDATGEAKSLRRLGLTLSYMGQEAPARAAVLEAKTIFERTQNRAELAMTYRTLLSVLEAGPEKDAVRVEGLRVARDAGETLAECGMLHGWGDEAFNKGRYAEANEHLTDSLTCYEGTTDLSATGTVLVSLGRVQRAHGRHTAALQYYTRALQLHERAGDDLMIVQSLNAIAVAHTFLGDREQAAVFYQRALERAQAIGSDQTIAFLEGQLGSVRLSAGDLTGAVPLLEASLRRDPRNIIYRQSQLADAYARSGRHDEALALANSAVTLARESGSEQMLVALRHRENVHYFAGRLDAAQADLTEAFGIVEELRSHTIATDFMKRGFGTLHQNLYSDSIDLLARRGATLEGLQTAERARARAFLDLLATRTSTAAATAVAKNGNEGASSTATPATAVTTVAPGTTAAPASAAGPLVTRGQALPGVPIADQTRRGAGGLLPHEQVELDPARRLASVERAEPPTADDVRAMAKRLKSTLVVYWVGYRATYIWVISPAGRVQSTRVEISETRVRDLVAAAAASIEGATSGLGSRAGQARPWRELHQLLIAPIKAFLPATPDSLLTIVPHGPLFQVSFAALQDERGKYLLEKYRLHYTPSIGVLEFTAARAYDEAATTGALLVGDPQPLPQTPGDDVMPPLPWARREVDEIGRLLGPEHATIVIGEDARESAIRGSIERADLLHFATHGVVQQEESFSSFLALSDRGHADAAGAADVPGAAGATSSSGKVATSLLEPAKADTNRQDDGRLTADEVYGLHLRARLVVLSACRTALGPLTGDGVIGFTRAFLYAGASSVIATSWDVPDEAGYHVMRRFYQERNGQAKGRVVQSADALRTAQLSVLASLRKGTFKTMTPSGAVALQEHPLLWAGFLIVGEP
jgi:CHAT domain-containing protein/tetratricopeptide (TPR) repeat protein